MNGREERQVAPPAYEDVVRSTRYPVLRSSVMGPHGGGPPGEGEPSTSQPTPWRLRFVDFTPHLPTSVSTSKRSQTDFYELVERANLWLSTNKDCQVSSCETVTWVSNTQARLNDTDVVNVSIKYSSKTYHMRGLRLWLAPKPSNDGEDTAADSIGVRDMVPDLGDETQKDLASFLKTVNTKIQEEPIPGRIVSVDTVLRRTSPNVKVKETYWTDTENGSRGYAFFLRIFYVKDEPSTDRIEIKDFCPEKCLNSRQKYDDFDSIICRANAWLSSQVSVNIISIQSVLLKKKESFRSGTEKMSFINHASKPASFMQCLRIISTAPHDTAIPLEPPNGDPPIFILKKTFAPMKKAFYEGRNEEPEELKYERLTKTVEQVSAWLASTGSNLFQVETLEVRQGAAGRRGPGPDTPFHQIHTRNADEWVTYVRCYLLADLSPTPPGPVMSPQSSRYIHLPAIGQRWYMRNPSQHNNTTQIFEERPRRKRGCCWVAIGVTVIAIVLLTCAFVIAYFLYFKKFFEEEDSGTARS